MSSSWFRVRRSRADRVSWVDDIFATLGLETHLEMPFDYNHEVVGGRQRWGVPGHGNHWSCGVFWWLSQGEIPRIGVSTSD